jgi:hypothetical protein
MSVGAPIAFVFQVSGDQEVKSKMQSMGGALSTLGQKGEQAAVSATRVQTNYREAALGLSAAATSATSLYFQYDNLSKIETRIAAAEKEVDSARATVLTNQNTLNSLIEKGITSGTQYEAAQLRLSVAQQQLAVAQDRASQAQGDLTQAQLQFGLQVIPTVLGAVSSLSAVKGILTSVTTAGTAAQAVQTQVNLGSIGSFNALSAFTTSASISTRAFGLATRAAQLAMGPLGLALIGISTVFTLVATNAFGIRDALDSFAKKVEDIFPILKPVFDFFRNIAAAIFPDTEEKTENLSNTFDSQFAKMSNTVNVNTGEQVTALGSLSDQFADTNTVASQNMSTLATNTELEATRIVSAAARAREAMASIGASPAVTAPAAATSPTFQQLGQGGGIDIASGAFMPSALSTSSTSTLPSNLQQLGPNIARDILSGQLVPINNNNSTIVHVSVQLDGQDIAAKVSKKTTSGMLGIT